MSVKGSIDALLQWCASLGFDIDPRLQIRPDENGGISVYTIEGGTEIKPKTTVVKIPKHAVLSSRNCVLSEFLEPLTVGLEAQLTLSLALYSEQLLEQKSKWFGYLQILPQMVELPLIWQSSLSIGGPSQADEDDRVRAFEWLNGTEAHRILHRKEEDGETLLEAVTDFYRLTGEPLLRGHIDLGFEGEISFVGFIKAFCLVSSRSFLVDRFHGLAMVPIADAFNHTQDNHVHIESDFEVCHQCGSADECPHDRQGEEPSFAGGDSDKTTGFFEMVTNIIVPPSTEVFNTYGETLSNAQLLTRYGFLLDANDNDAVCWTFDEVFHELGVDPNTAIEDEDISVVDAVVRRLDELLHYHPFMQSAHQSGVLTVHDDEGSKISLQSKSKMLFIDSDGKASVGLWLALMLISDYSANQTFQVTESVLVVKELMELLNVFTTMLESEESDNPSEPEDDFLDIMNKTYLRLINQQGKSLIRLCEQRKRSIGKPEVNDREVGEIMDSLDKHHTRTRDALTIVLSERAILSSCQETWNEFLELLSSKL